MNAKEAARAALERERSELVALSHRIHANPELGFEEEKACGWLCELLDRAGFAVRRGVCELPTAFAAHFGSGPLRLVLCAEYDCLPAIGHACGHNIIAAMSAGAALALRPVADDLGLSVTVLGTPAEEVGEGAGKILMLERGAFAGAHFAMMAHPAPFDMAAPPMIAAARFDVSYIGKEAHASAFPERGVNAADALTIAQVAIGLLRQQLRPGDQVHGIVTRGGDAPNVIPARTAARFMVRARNTGELGQLRERVRRCFEAGALATGAQLEITGGDKPYAHLASDPTLVAIYQRNAEALGRSFALPPELLERMSRGGGSTDMGNVSLVLPSIHPMIGIDSLPAVNHQPEFTACCVTEAADRALFEGALALAWTAIDAASDAAARTYLMEPRNRKSQSL